MHFFLKFRVFVRIFTSTWRCQRVERPRKSTPMRGERAQPLISLSISRTQQQRTKAFGERESLFVAAKGTTIASPL
jgi:hypothetical protein